MRWVLPATAETPAPPPDVTGLAIAEMVHGSTPSVQAIDAWLGRHQVPIAERGKVTFVFRGPADEVRLRHWVYGLTSSEPLHRVPGTDLWYHVLELPEGSRVEYKLEVTRGRDVQWLEDPLNARRARDPFGATSVAHGSGYEVPEWTRPDAFAPQGMPGVVAALMHPPERLEQYRANEAHTRHLTHELVPQLEAELPLLATPEGRCLMGASLGAVASLSTAVQYPGFYGRLLLQSGSFAFSDIGGHGRGPIFDPVADFVNRFRKHPTAVSQRVFVSCGMYESLIYENRSLVPILQKAGMEVRFSEARDGHNWENWRDRLREGLSWLFPGPLWLVYE